MVVNFNADSSRHFEGFTAKVRSVALGVNLLIVGSDLSDYPDQLINDKRRFYVHFAIAVIYFA